MAAGWKDALMADTGAPWNIPYVEPADLVRDYPAADEAQALAIAAGLTAAGPAGVGSNVVQTIKTNTFTTSSTSFTTVTGLSASITPSTNTSKVLVIVQIAYALSNGVGYGHFKITGGNTSGYVGDADGSRIQAVFGGQNASDNRLNLMSGSIVFLDSPASGAATTYQVEVRAGTSGSVIVNQFADDSNNTALTTRGASSITLIEVEP
jgi:hypothetical protein